MLSYKSYRSADLPRVNEPAGSPSLVYPGEFDASPERFRRKVETGRDEIRAYGWGITGQAVEEL
jgi:hypothetical protein